MALVVNPQPFSRDVDRLFDAFFGGERESRRWVPQMDLVEAEDHFVLKADLPGLDEGDVSIEVQDGTLTISGERKTEHETRERGWYRIERSFGSFSRSLTLPDRVDPDAISARFDRGVLEVRIPKPEEHKPRRVEISAGAARTAGRPPWRAARRRRSRAARSSARGPLVRRAAPERQHVGPPVGAAPPFL